MSDTARFTLPLIEAAQAQKHVTHNEALVLLDALAHLHLLDRDLTAPPGSPLDGDTYLVASGATGGWASHDGEIAWALDGGWRFHEPVEGLLAHVADEGILIVYSAAAWSEVSGVADISTVPAFGIGAAADETATDTSNKLIVRGARALFDAAPDSETPGTGDFKVQISKEAAGNFASFFFADNYEGRAELGLLADDDFSIKVSPDNSTWYEAVRIDKDDGTADFPAGFTDPAGLRGKLSAAGSGGDSLTGNYNIEGQIFLDFLYANQFSSGLSVRKRGQSGDANGSVLTNAEIGYHMFWGWDGDSYGRCSFVIVKAEEDFSDTTLGARYEIFTVPIGSATTQRRMTIKNDGKVGINTATPSTQLHVDGPVRVGSYTVATVPSAAASGAGAMIYISNETGGAVIAQSDGADWQRLTDLATIS